MLIIFLKIPILLIDNQSIKPKINNNKNIKMSIFFTFLYLGNNTIMMQDNNIGNKNEMNFLNIAIILHD